jgi:hypothetical protein
MGKTTSEVNQAMNDHVADKKPIATEQEIVKAFPLSDTLRYIQNSTYVANPTLILGKAFYQKIDEDKLIPFLTNIPVTVNEKSILTSPLTVAEIIINKKIALSAGFLSFVSASMNDEDVYEFRIIDNSAARVVDSGNQWEQALMKWMNSPLVQNVINDPQTGAISIVTGMVQKYITQKKFTKFEVGAKGGAYGINVDGSLYTSSSEFQLTILYGLDMVSYGPVHHITKLAANMATGTTLPKDDLQNVNRLFYNMAISRASIF